MEYDIPISSGEGSEFFFMNNKIRMLCDEKYAAVVERGRAEILQLLGRTMP